MKPEWKDAPEWAQWLAQDECGDWWWFQHRPVCDETTWWPSSCAGEWMAVEGAPNPNWRDTLERRPVTDSDILEATDFALQAEIFDNRRLIEALRPLAAAADRYGPKEVSDDDARRARDLLRELGEWPEATPEVRHIAAGLGIPAEQLQRDLATHRDTPHEPRPDELEDLFRDGEGEPWTWPRGATVRNVSAVLEEAPGAAIRYRVRYQRWVDGTWRDCDHASWFREDVEKIRADLLRDAGDGCSSCGEPGVEHRDTGCPPRHPGFPGGMGQP